MELLKKEILENVPDYSPENISWHSIDEFADLAKEINGYTAYDAVIQAALDKYKCVKIEKMPNTLYLSEPIVMKTGYRLFVADEQVISNIPGDKHCLIRNAAIENGFAKPVSHTNPDTDISIEGGIWDGAHISDSRFGPGDKETVEGAMAIIILSNVENVIVRNAEFKNGGGNYAVQISNASHFHINDLTFVKYGRDGVHINGPASYGEVHNLHGRDMGDDMVAVNAWDWDRSAISFGTAQYLYIHDNESHNNEFRLLPGKKMYEASSVDCDIRNCIIENLSGIYTFKLYCQPNIRNAIDKTSHDISGDVGNVYNLYFKNITINEKRGGGFHNIPVNGIFDICSNCRDLHFEDIKVDFPKCEFDKDDIYLISVGPLSAVWTNNSENPDDWGEVFNPDAVCSAENIFLKNVTFKNEKILDSDALVREVHMTINEDYPNTVPKGGTGFGTVKNVVVE